MDITHISPERARAPAQWSGWLAPLSFAAYITWAAIAVAAVDIDTLQSGLLREWSGLACLIGMLGLFIWRSLRDGAVDCRGARWNSVAQGALVVLAERLLMEGQVTVLLVVVAAQLVLLMPPGHPLAPVGALKAVALERILEHDLVAFARPTSLTRQLAAAAEALQRPLRIRAQVRSFDAMGRMVAAGLGLAVLPREGARPYAHALGLITASIEGLRTERHLLWAWRDSASLSPAAQALIRMSQGAAG